MDTDHSKARNFWLYRLLGLAFLVLVVFVSFTAFRINMCIVPNSCNTYIINGTPTAGMTPSPTAQGNKNHSYPSYMLGHGTLAFFDPLSQESGSQWSTSGPDGSGGACQFTGGAYHVSEQDIMYFKNCNARGTYSNFAFEVQFAVTQGMCGGMIFRNDGLGNFYYLRICPVGTYTTSKYVNGDHPPLNPVNSTAIHTGLNQQNTMAVVASGSTMTFYVNRQQITQENDSSYTTGSIGLIAGTDGTAATEVAYTNATLWTL